MTDRSDTDFDVVYLLQILASLIPQEQHFNTLSHFTHYILQIAGTLQKYSIAW